MKYNNYSQKYNLMTPVKELNPTHVISQALIRYHQGPIDQLPSRPPNQGPM